MHRSIELYVRADLYGFADHPPLLALPVARAAFAAIRVRREYPGTRGGIHRATLLIAPEQDPWRTCQEGALWIPGEDDRAYPPEQQEWRVIFRSGIPGQD